MHISHLSWNVKTWCPLGFKLRPGYKAPLCHFVKCMKERISLFDFTTLSFELFTHKYYVSMVSSSSENQNVTKFFEHPFCKKRLDHHPWKVTLFGGHAFSQERDNKTCLKFNMKKVVLLVYLMMPRMLGLVDEWLTLMPIWISRYFGLRVRFTGDLWALYYFKPRSFKLSCA
jgi:hypothetical protein